MGYGSYYHGDENAWNQIETGYQCKHLPKGDWAENGFLAGEDGWDPDRRERKN